MADSSWPGEQLIVAAQRGDVDSIIALVSGSHPNVQRFARSLCATPEDAEDAAQEALIILYRKIGMLRTSGALASWMFRIVRNECLRRARTMRAHALLPDAAVRSAEEVVLQRIEAGEVAAAVAALPRVCTAPALRSSTPSVPRPNLRLEIPMSTTKTDGPDFASSSLPRHLVRGVIGFGGLIGSVAFIPTVGPVSLLLLPVGVLALRGCPMCWTIGLIQTISRGRLQRTCEDGRCKLTVAYRDHEERPTESVSL